MPPIAVPEIQENRPVENRLAEAGYLLASTGILILIITALLGSYAFVITRNTHFKSNYAVGERFAELATMAHSYAQLEHYQSGVSLDGAGDLYGGSYLNPPDGYTFGPVANTDFSVEIIGRDASPVNASTPASVKAASAYLHLRIRPRNGTGRPPSDEAALQSGANFKGMQRIGYYKMGFAAGDQCDGSATAVRWGSEDDSCLNDTETSMFSDLQKGDIIVPAWETALASMNANAMFRYPQPQRGDTSTMLTDLNMSNNNINSATNATADIATATSASGTASNFGSMNVRDGSPMQFNGQANMNSGLNVYDQAGGPSPMTVTNAVPVSLNGPNLNVGQSINGPTMVTTAVNDVSVQTVDGTNSTTSDTLNGNTMPTLEVGSLSGAKMIVSTPSLNPVKYLNVGSAGGNLGVAKNLVATSTALTTTDVYAGQLTTQGAGAITSTGNWNVGSIQQTGSGSLGVQNMQVNVDCYSNGSPNACPHSAMGGGGGGF